MSGSLNQIQTMSYSTTMRVSRKVHRELYDRKRRPGETFDEVLRRELNLDAEPEPEAPEP